MNGQQILKFNIGKILFAALILLLIITTILLNVVAGKLDKRYSLTGDLTGNSAYKIGTETMSLLEKLDREVNIFVLAEESSFTGNSYLIQANRMIREYPAKSPKVSLRYIDIMQEPTFVSQYPDLVLEQGNILVSSGDNTKQLKLSELFNYERNAEEQVVIASSRAEEAISAAIMSVTSDVKINIAILKGNGVADKNDFSTLLNDNGFGVSEVNIATEKLDSGYDAALLLAPQKDLSAAAIDQIEQFLYNGGEYGKMLIYTADATQDSLPVMEAYLKEWGVAVGDGAVFETKEERTYQSQPFYPVADFADNTYSAQLIDSTAPMLMPVARPLETLFEVRDNQYTSNLLIFAESTGVKPSAAENFSPDQAEQRGPMPALVMASRRIKSIDGTETKESNILVSASTEMLDAFSIHNSSLANSEFMVKLLNSNFGKEESTTILPKSLAGSILAVNTRQKNTIGLILAVIIPVIIIAAGIVVFAMRRHK
jgi:hypothetical protein